MKALLLALVLLTPTPTPTLTATSTPTATMTATAVPSATVTPAPSPSPIPQGQQANGTYCTGLFGWCPDLGAFMQQLVNAFLGVINGAIGDWLGLTPSVPSGHTAAHVSAAASPTPVATPNARGATAAGQDIVTQVLTVITTEADYTAPAFSPLMSLFAWVMQIAQSILGGLMALGLLVTYWEGLTRGQGRAWLDFGLRFLLVILYLKALSPAAHLWAQAMGGLAAGFSSQGMSGFVGTIVGLLNPGTGNDTLSLASGTMGLLLAAALLGVFAVMAIVLLWQRLVADAIMALTLALAPLAVATLANRHTRSAGWVWLRTYVAFSLYAPVTAAFIQVLDRVLQSFAGDATFGAPVVKAVLSLVCLGALLKVPSLCMRVTGGGIEMSAWGVPRLSSVTKLLPLL